MSLDNVTNANKKLSQRGSPFFIWRHLNKLRWLVLLMVFISLILIPFLHIYQSFVAAHAYDLLSSSEKTIYDAMQAISSPFVHDAETDLDALKGTTWSGEFFGITLSDPLAVLNFSAANHYFNGAFFLTALIPIVLTIIFGRFFCGWICPATFLYELNSNVAAWLNKRDYIFGQRRFDRRYKYIVLFILLLLSMFTGTVLTASVYPPAIIGREIYYAIALQGFGLGAVFFIFTLLFDLLVARRGFCRYLCPGGALYSLLGRYRIVRIKRIVENCNDCEKCNAVCEFALDPMGDDFGQECNNCTACVAVCPSEALTFHIKPSDIQKQGPGHLGKKYKRQVNEGLT